MTDLYRGDMWEIPTSGGTRKVIIISPDGTLNDQGPVDVVICYETGTYSESLLVVPIDAPTPCMAVTKQSATFEHKRFIEQGAFLGPVPAPTMARVDSGLRAALGL